MKMWTLLFMLAPSLCSGTAMAMCDTLPQALKQREVIGFVKQTEAKIAQYSRRIDNGTERTLVKLARWESKIKQLLEKASPETAQRLFGNGQQTFAALLQQYQQGSRIAQARAKNYDVYRDRLQGTMQYLSGQNSKAKEAKRQLQQLDSLVNDTDAVQQFIKERKRQLAEQCVQYIGNSKYLQKIDRESYYYVQTLRNYKELFNDKKKAEELAMKLLKKVPGFESFLQRNSALAGLFGTNASSGTSPNLAGLQTRASVSALMQNQLGSGANGQAILTQRIEGARAQLNQLKDRIAKTGSGDGELPRFKPNGQKTKTFFQRLEYTANIGFGKLATLTRNRGATADIALGIGYKLNDNGTIGIGASYKLGMGSLQRICFSGEGIGLRSYVDWKLKKQIYISGGYESNYLPTLENVRPLIPADGRSIGAWQQSGLIGISKKTKVQGKWFKGGHVRLLYDMLYRNHTPESSPFVFRIGYSFK